MQNSFDVIVVGAGVGGVCSALGAARTGVRTLVLEAAPQIGGTGVHSPVACVTEFWDASGRPIIEGLLKEIFPDAYENYLTHVRTYDDQELLRTYRRLLEAEENITVRTGSPVVEVLRDGDTITALKVKGDDEPIHGKVFIDGTGDGNLAAPAGAEFQKGRRDGRMQPSTVTFKVTDVDFHKFPEPDLQRWSSWGKAMYEINQIYQKAKKEGRIDNPREKALFFPYPDGKSLLFNSTRICGVDPTDEQSVERARAEGRRQARELYELVKEHPALAGSRLESIFAKVGVREGRRVVGDYMLTADDILEEARFEDMISACSYIIDIHDVNSGKTTTVRIPGSGYYHIPYRSLIAKGLANLLMGSRCISGTHTAHSSYRVMCALSAIAHGAGVAAALTVLKGASDVREIEAAEIRWILKQQNAFVEGETRRPAS